MVFRILLLLSITVSAFAAEVAGVKIPDADQQLLLKIWLGEQPVQADLKKALLGEMRGEKQ